MTKTPSKNKYTSKGERPNVSKKVLNSVNSGISELQTRINKLKGWTKSQNPCITIMNPDTNQTNKKMIRVRSNDYYGDPRSIKPFTF